MVGPTSSRRDFIRSVAFDGGTATIVSANTDNIVFLDDDAFSTAKWVRIGTEPARSGNPYENEPGSRPEWLIDPKPITYPPNRAQRRAMRKGKKR